MAGKDPSALAVRIERKDDTEVVVLIDESVYSRAAVLRALHWYTDRLLIQISAQNAPHLAVTLRAKNGASNLSAVLAEFENSLLDAQLRVVIGRETAAIRELIVAKAFAEGDLLDDPPVGDWRDPVASSGKSGGD